MLRTALLLFLVGLIAARSERCEASENPRDSTLKCSILGNVQNSGTQHKIADPSVAAANRAFEITKILVENDLIDRYDHYSCESYWYGNIWGNLSISIVVLTTISSLLAAFDVGKWSFGKYVLAGLSAFAALISTILVQFHIKDNWQLRENGQISVQLMQEEIRNIRPDTADAMTKLSKVHVRAIELERSQTTQFFGQAPSQTPATGSAQ